MAFNIRSILNRATLARLDATQATMTRLHALPDLQLGREIIELCRAVRAELTAAGDPYVNDLDRPVYHTNLLWSVLPELARRLGETDFLPNEHARPELTAKHGQELRDFVGAYIQHSSFALNAQSGQDRETPLASELLRHEPCNGNPIAIALDRLAPPTALSKDYPARSIREVGRHLRLPRSRGRFADLGATCRLLLFACWLRRPWASGNPGPSAA